VHYTDAGTVSRHYRRRPPLDGVAAGLAATAAMSGVLVAAAAAGMMRDQPPVLIARKFLPNLPEPLLQASSWVAHFGYGAAGGVLHHVVQRSRPSVAKGAAYGLALWAASYEGWVPVAGVLPPAHADDRRRVATMVTAHLVYGAVLGALARRPRR
jgi:uncharacterized membrane protein (UPF0136 family)